MLCETSNSFNKYIAIMTENLSKERKPKTAIMDISDGKVEANVFRMLDYFNGLSTKRKNNKWRVIDKLDAKMK